MKYKLTTRKLTLAYNIFVNAHTVPVTRWHALASTLAYITCGGLAIWLVSFTGIISGNSLLQWVLFGGSSYYCGFRAQGRV